MFHHLRTAAQVQRTTSKPNSRFKNDLYSASVAPRRLPQNVPKQATLNAGGPAKNDLQWPGGVHSLARRRSRRSSTFLVASLRVAAHERLNVASVIPLGSPDSAVSSPPHGFAICRCDLYQRVVPGPLLALATETQSTSSLCSRCGKPTKFITSILDPQSGKRFRIFECECGARSCNPESNIDRVCRRSVTGFSHRPL